MRARHDPRMRRSSAPDALISSTRSHSASRPSSPLVAPARCSPTPPFILPAAQFQERCNPRSRSSSPAVLGRHSPRAAALAALAVRQASSSRSPAIPRRHSVGDLHDLERSPLSYFAEGRKLYLETVQSVITNKCRLPQIEPQPPQTAMPCSVSRVPILQILHMNDFSFCSSPNAHNFRCSWIL